MLSSPNVSLSEQNHIALRLALYNQHEEVASLLLADPRNGISREAALELNRHQRPVLQFDTAPISSFEFPSEFVCRSGEMLWGQLQCIVEGATASMEETQETPLAGRFTGTILDHDYRFKVAAKLGTWRVARTYCQTPESPGKRFNAFVAYHESADVRNLIVQAAKIGISNDQHHKNKDIVYINRYNWVRECT